MTKLLEYLEVALHITTIICLVAIAISLILFIYRVITGPSNPDRAMALDVIGVCLMAIAALTSILVITTKLTDVILLIGILSFIGTDRKSTRLNSSHVAISYAVFCLKKK